MDFSIWKMFEEIYCLQRAIDSSYIHQLSTEHTMYQRKVDVDMLNALKTVLADVSFER